MKNNLRQGATYAVSAAAAFALTGVCIKQAALTAPNEVVVFFRCAVSLLALLPWALKRGPGALKTQRWGGHLLRSLLGCAAMYCFFHTIAHMPLAEAMLLTYSTPLWIPFIAWAWIEEKPTGIVIASSLVGLAGLALIVKPGSAGMSGIGGQVGLIGVLSSLFAAAAMVNIRRISDTEPAERVVFYFAALSTVLSALPLPWAWKTPDTWTLALLIGAGLTATVGQLNLTRAYSCAPAAQVGPFTYMAVIFSGLLAWLLWGERMDGWSILGSVIVIASCVLAGWRRKEPHLEE